MIEHELRVRRRARYYSLGDLTAASDVWVVVHGYGQLAREFIADCEALVAPGRAVVAPEALNRFYKDDGRAGTHANTPVGATWMTREHREAEIADYVEYLDHLAQEVCARGGRLGVVGFSQGVPTVTRWVASGSALFHRIVLWAGELPTDVDLGAARERFPASGVDFVLGTRDAYGEWINADKQLGRLAAAGIAARLVSFDGGHRLDHDTLVSLANR